MNFPSKVKRIPGLGVFLLALALSGAIAFLDYITKEDISAYVFYSLPIFIAAWYGGKLAGVTIGILSAIAWLIIDLFENAIPYNAHMFWNFFVRLVFFSCIAYLMNALQSTLEREKSLARRDDLTGVANRRTFFDLGNQEIQRAQRYPHSFTVVFLDLDNFKAINDCLGHRIGDSLLRAVAETLESNTRSTDLVARLGGDEFVMLLTETGPEEALVVVEKLRDLLIQTMKSNQWEVTFSIGVTTYLTPPISVDEMLANPDRLMYQAKQSGKNALKHEVVTPSGSRIM